MEGQTTIYDFFLNQKKYDPVEAYAKRGSGFEGGKKRIFNFFNENQNANERAKFLQKEYGTGGFGSPCTEPCSLWRGDSQGNLHEILYRDEENRISKVTITNNQLEKVIDKLIKSGEYLMKC